MATAAVRVQTRVRPYKRSDGAYDPAALKVNSASLSVKSVDKATTYKYDFDRCHGEDSSQEEVFEGVRPLLGDVFKGGSCTVFAYGVTGSGKTHTMQGTCADPGLIPRTVEAVFEQAAQFPDGCEVSMSYVEILKDEVYDLLHERPGCRKLSLRSSEEGQVVVADLTTTPVSSVESFESVYAKASRARTTAATSLNSESSRSHAILTLNVWRLDSRQNPVSRGKICLCDLAGSENNKLTNNNPERMKESACINKSLTALGLVVEAINTKAARIPYRDTKLTRLLQDALGGGSKAILLCCLAPGAKFTKDLINTLNFGSRTRKVENRLSMNAREIKPQPRHSHNVNRSFQVAADPATNRLGGAGGAIEARRHTYNVLTQSVRTSNIPTAATRVGRIGKAADKENEGKQADKVPEGKYMTEDQVKAMVESLVNQRLEAMPKPEALPAVPAQEAKPVQMVADEGAPASEEDMHRVRIFVDHARTLHASGDLTGALEQYRRAAALAPKNKRLAERVTAVSMAIEGLIPAPKLSKPVRHSDPEAPSSGMKRSRAFKSDDLAVLTRDDDLAQPSGPAPDAKRPKTLRM